MQKSISLLLCLLIIVSIVLCACDGGADEAPTTEPPAQTTTAPATVAPTTAPVPATKDSVAKTGYDFVAIKKKSGDIISQFDKIVESNKYLGSIYMKLGNDFEYISSHGAADNTKHIDNSINTRFYVGDVTKQFSAAAVMLLTEKKKLKLDDTLDKFFPDYSYAEKITVEQLLNMTSGIKTYVSHNDITNPPSYLVNELNEAVKEDNSAEENKELILDWIFEQELAFEPGTRFALSDSNYYLLGEIIEQASGEEYTEFVEKFILKPLGMGSSGFEADKKTAIPYDRGANTQSLNYKGVGYSSSGMISSVSDLLKWIDGLHNNQLLSSASVNMMFSNRLTGIKNNKKAYGFGADLNGKYISSTGRFDAYSAYLIYNIDESEIYIALTNYTASDNKLVYNSFKKVLQKFAV